MTYGLIYNSVGEIQRQINSNIESILLQKKEDDEFLILNSNIVDAATNYINNEVVTPKPTQGTILSTTTINANGADAVNILSAPIGANCTIVNTITRREVVTGEIDGTDSFSTTVVGQYKITISLWPYLDFEATINAI